jgi:hypothetical protein
MWIRNGIPSAAKAGRVWGGSAAWLKPCPFKAASFLRHVKTPFFQTSIYQDVHKKHQS